MIARLPERVGQVLMVMAALPSSRWRMVVREGWALERRLARLLDEQPLPRVMEELTPATPASEPRVRDRERIRTLADAIVALDVRSPLGHCLRQSLVRYYLLRRAGTPVTICFGARKHAGTVLLPAKLTGHAWLVLRGMPYAEEHHHYRDFTVMYSYPESRQLKLEL
jgi:hypothetical protein